MKITLLGETGHGSYSHDEQGHRVDVHRPSAINPGDYEYLKVGEKRAALKEGKKLAGPGGTCHHCGKAIVWEVYFTHKPTGGIVTFGYQCAGILEMTDNRIDHEMNLLKRQAENERRDEAKKMEREDREAKFKAQYPELYEFVMEFDEDNGFINRIKWGIETFGSPLEYQIDSLKRFIEGRKNFLIAKMEQDRLLQDAPVLEDGRRHIEGTVLSDKYVEGNYGTTHKMLVQLDDGNKVYGSVPNSIYLDAGSEIKGKRVAFDAKVEAKEDHFGFFSRPTKAKVI